MAFAYRLVSTPVNRIARALTYFRLRCTRAERIRNEEIKDTLEVLNPNIGEDGCTLRKKWSKIRFQKVACQIQ